MASLRDIADEIGGSIHDAFALYGCLGSHFGPARSYDGWDRVAMAASTSQALHLADPPRHAYFRTA